jgi:hypothetical protein
MGLPSQLVAPGKAFCVTVTPANADTHRTNLSVASILHFEIQGVFYYGQCQLTTVDAIP